MSMPARSSSPPRLAKAFCMSTTITADLSSVTSIASGRVASLSIGHHDCLNSLLPGREVYTAPCCAMIGARRSSELTEHSYVRQGGIMTLSRGYQTWAALAMLLAGATGVHAADTCDRACLEGYVDRYLDALLAHQPSLLPLAPGVRFTEDGQQLLLGDGLWNTMHAKGRYRLFVTDVPAGQVAFFGSIQEDNRDPAMGTPALIALRLKVRNRQIAEIEQIVIRDERAAKRVDELTPNPVYTQAIPPAERMSRTDLIATANKYFSGMQQNDGKGDYPFADDC